MRAGFAILVFVALATQRSGAQEAIRRVGVTELARAPLSAVAKLGVTHPLPRIHTLYADGRPVLSEAGFLQLADEGPGFYYGALNADRVDYARSVGMLGTNNWGDVESMCLAGRVVAHWHHAHPTVRLGLDEISSRWAGFPDYDKDGISDHLTHQVGMNINFLVPCSVRPERYIHHGVAHEGLIDHALFIDLLDILMEQGALWLTTNRGLFSLTDQLSDSGSRHAWQSQERLANGYSMTLAIPGKAFRLVLLNPKGDHGDHINAMMWKDA
ncbi:MAG: hypothetical protein EXS14_09510 [Planctomycetes bacterium]|nr:hypothetical protein [Planctomycetota bacterium]